MTTTNEKVTFTIKGEPHPVLAFQNLIKPRQYKGKGKFQYDCRLVFTPDHSDIAKLKTLAAQVAVATFPQVELTSYNKPWQTGEEFAAENAEGVKRGNKAIDCAPFLGKVLVSMRSEYPPQLGMIENNQLVLFEGQSAPLAEKHIWSGQIVGATVEITAYFVDGRYYIKFYPKDVISYGGGTRVGGGKAEERWSEYTGRVSTVVPQAGAALATNW